MKVWRNFAVNQTKRIFLKEGEYIDGLQTSTSKLNLKSSSSYSETYKLMQKLNDKKKNALSSSNIQRKYEDIETKFD